MTHTNLITGTPLTSNMLLSLREVSDLTGHDRKTLTKWIGEGRYPNAVQDQTGRKGWRIPVQDLVAAGNIDPSAVVEVATTIETMRESKQVGELRTRIAELEAALDVQTALADERRDMVGTLQALLATVLPSGATR